MLASLPWYEVPGTEALYDALWSHASSFLREAGFSGPVPHSLDRTLRGDELLTSRDLLVSQTCGFDIAEDLPLPLQVIGSFSFCGPTGMYTSFLVVHENRKVRSLQDLEGKTFVANDPRSYSGFHVMKSFFPRPEELFRHIHWSGSHVASLKFIQSQAADVAAIDSTTYALLRKFAPHLLAKTRLIAESKAVPAPPLVTSTARSCDDLEKLRAAFFRLFAEPKSRAICHELLIEGVRVWPKEAFQQLRARQATSPPAYL